MIKAAEEMQDQPLWLVTDKNYHYLNPIHIAYHGHAKAVHAAINQIGLSPHARSKIKHLSNQTELFGNQNN